MRATACLPSAMPGTGAPEVENSLVRSEGRRTGLSSQSRGRALQTGLLFKLYQLTSVHSRDNLPEDTDDRTRPVRAEGRRAPANRRAEGSPASASPARAGPPARSSGTPARTARLATRSPRGGHHRLPLVGINVDLALLPGCDLVAAPRVTWLAHDPRVVPARGQDKRHVVALIVFLLVIQRETSTISEKGAAIMRPKQFPGVANTPDGGSAAASRRWPALRSSKAPG